LLLQIRVRITRLTDQAPSRAYVPGQCVVAYTPEADLG
jgi:hypothetical protein